LIFNFRDIGGCRTADGKTVARGLVFRGAEFDYGPGSGAVRLLVRLGIRRVIDLREPSEVGTATLSGVDRVHVPFLVSMQSRDFQPIDRSPAATAWRYYEYLTEGKTSVLEVMRRLATSRAEPTMVHCVAGRDRTGIVTACLLGALGVPDEQIALDYAASLVMDDDEGRRAHPDNILHLLRIIRERHGSIRGLYAEEPDDELPFATLKQVLVEH
jgi:protein tyrosine/serine phosphatase